MNRKELLREMHLTRLVAVVRSKGAEEASATARAAGEAGVNFVEITFSVPGALDVIARLAQQKDVHVGAGTVLSVEQGEAAIRAGAEFVVSPSLELNLVPVCHAAQVACFPGAATPTEVISAARAHADLVKIFPADLLGGVEFLRQMAGPFPDIRFMVSGGVNRANVKDYVQIGATGICLGSAYLAATLAQKGEVRLVGELREFVKLVAEAEGA
ncbi:MAG TPA: bifunctional 4-hydroxy-2-oxoglutarate aldolase/2-dehydro-3-deoxy-phosphogluconate aldolase [Candidatus Binatia bacterium]|nr:bifunctional 4-hydroxy-2-oxoglutarate aldolase/2-dehydro-3-deoxy-phosphogluconate aldolase [Candidatus Binatia bacterium]